MTTNPLGADQPGGAPFGSFMVGQRVVCIADEWIAHDPIKDLRTLELPVKGHVYTIHLIKLTEPGYVLVSQGGKPVNADNRLMLGFAELPIGVFNALKFRPADQVAAAARV